jgi:4-oxalocrotonate tautomerase
MPLVSMKILAGRNAEQKKKLVKEVTEAVVRNLKVEPETVIIDIIEYTKENFAKAGKLFSDT